MSEQITVYDRVADTQTAIATLAQNIAKSSMFACENEGQAYILALECFARRCTPVDLLSRYHLIKGKLTLKANVMLAEANARGWLHTVKRRDVDGAAIVLRHESNPDHAVEVALTWDQAKAEPFVYEGKELVVIQLLAAGKTPNLKAKYSTPRARMQMLWARVVSDVVNACCPEAACGLYPPEVVADFDSDRDYSWNDEDTQQMRKSSPASRAKPAKKVSAVVAEHVEPQVLPAGPVEVISTAPATATDKQIADLRGLAELLRLSTQQIGDCLREHGADRFAGLSRAAADKIATQWHNLAAESAQVQSELVEQAEERAAIVSVEAQQEAEDAYAMSVDEPCSPEQVEQIKALVVEVEQISPGVKDKLRQKLHDSGMKKIADLSFGDARRLINLLEVRAIEAFFASTLTPGVPF
jgi:hypothetical protein